VPVGLAELGYALEVLVDQLAHPALEQLGERLSGTGATIRAPLHASACMAFIIAKAIGKLLIVEASGVLHHADLIKSRSTPSRS
jgi:hypothetical protein